MPGSKGDDGSQNRGARCRWRVGVGEAEYGWDTGPDRTGQGGEVGQSMEERSLIEVQPARSRRSFSQEGAAGALLCAGKTVLAGVGARSRWQKDGDQVGGGWTNPGEKKKTCPEPGSEAGRAQDSARPHCVKLRLCHLLWDPRYVT